MAPGPLDYCGDVVHFFYFSIGSALQELSKDKPVMKNVESHTTTFIKTLVEVEKKLTGHINYLTQVSTGIKYKLLHVVYSIYTCKHCKWIL